MAPRVVALLVFTCTLLVFTRLLTDLVCVNSFKCSSSSKDTICYTTSVNFGRYGRYFGLSREHQHLSAPIL